MFTHIFCLSVSALAIYLARQSRSAKTPVNQSGTLNLNSRYQYLLAQYMRKSANQFFLDSQNEKNPNEQF